jgi:2'-5' RNA ligase
MASIGGRAAAEPAWRCFVAVPIPDLLRAELADLVAGWRVEPDAPAMRWTDPDGWHLTLAFLGSVPAATVPGIREALRAAADGETAFDVPCGGTGGFPSTRRARVVWYGIEDPGGRLHRLAGIVHSALAPMVPDLHEQSRFRGHLTLGRARDENGSPIDGWLATHPVPDGTIGVDRIILYRSHLGRGPARYEALESVSLRSAAGRDRVAKGDERG